METEGGASPNWGELLQNRQKYNKTINLIRQNLEQAKPIDIYEWIDECYNYAAYCRQFGFRLIPEGKIFLADNNGSITNRQPTRDDIIEIYDKRISPLEQYEKTVASKVIPGGSLLLHEEKHKGHTKNKHIPKLVDNLWERISNGKKKASGFLSFDIATNAIARTIAFNTRKIDEWLEGSGYKESFTHNFDQQIGLIAREGYNSTISGSRTIVVLKKDKIAPAHYKILTSYIENE